MSLLDRFRSWLGFEVRGFDQDIRTDTENAAQYIKQRTAMHVANMHRDVEAFFDDMLAEQQRQRHEDKPLTFEPVGVPAPAALAAPVKPEPEAPASATPSQVVASELSVPEPEQAAPAENDRRAAPKATKKTAPVRQKAEAPSPAMPPEPPAPEQATPSSEIMDDAALAALIQRDRLAAGKKKKA